MRTRYRFLPICLAALCVAAVVSAMDTGESGQGLTFAHDSTVTCRAALAPPPSSPGSAPRQYARDREMELLHLALDVTPNFKQRTVSGTATLTFKPIAKSLEEIKLDAVDL